MRRCWCVLSNINKISKYVCVFVFQIIVEIVMLVCYNCVLPTHFDSCTEYHCTQYRCTKFHCTKYHCTQYHCTVYHCTKYRCTEYRCVTAVGNTEEFKGSGDVK